MFICMNSQFDVLSPVRVEVIITHFSVILSKNYHVALFCDVKVYNSSLRVLIYDLSNKISLSLLPCSVVY